MEVDIYVLDLSPSSLLLCSDGLWGLVKNDAAEIILLRSRSLRATDHSQQNGEDNITAVMVSMGVE
jgi:serine/threonine protein phosphatase PrpC